MLPARCDVPNLEPVFAVLIEVDVQGVDEDAGLTTLREQIVPAIKSLPGFRSGTWLPGNEDGKGLSLTVWDTEADAQVMAERFGPGSSPTAGAACPGVSMAELPSSARSPARVDRAGRLARFRRFHRPGLDNRDPRQAT